MTAIDEKRALRASVRARRAARTAAQREEAGRALAAHAHALPSRCVAAFVGVGSEPPTVPLLEALAARGVRVLLPILRPDGTLDWSAWEGEDALREGLRGTREPAGGALGRAALAAAELVLAPALAVDGSGRRLGQGGGSYDRALPSFAGPVAAVVYDDELVDAVPAEPHDVSVSAALTPARGLVPLGGSLP